MCTATATSLHFTSLRFTSFRFISQGVANLKDYNEFYYRAEHGTLPNFSFILPREGTNTTTG